MPHPTYPNLSPAQADLMRRPRAPGQFHVDGLVTMGGSTVCNCVENNCHEVNGFLHQGLITVEQGLAWHRGTIVPRLLAETSTLHPVPMPSPEENGVRHAIRNQRELDYLNNTWFRQYPRSLTPPHNFVLLGPNDVRQLNEALGYSPPLPVPTIDPSEDNEEEDMPPIPTTMNRPKRMTTFKCAHCTSVYPISARAAQKLETSIVRDGVWLDRICKHCSASYYTYTNYNLANPGGDHGHNNRNCRWVRSDAARHLRDVGCYVSLAFAERHAHRSGNEWFLSEAIAREYEARQRRRQREQLDIFRAQAARVQPPHIFGYHEVQNVTLFGWPEVTPKDSLCFGVELEMENRKDGDTSGCIKLSQALGGRLDEPSGAPADRPKNRFVLARDGSLGLSGVELITNPYTLDYHQNVFGWKELLGPAVKVGACAGAHTTRCGMHVHVNRKALSPLVLGKALIFVNSNSNRALIERIAQRSSNSYTNLLPKVIADGRKSATSKYEAMHLGDATVEFRIFRGNLRADRVLKNIEFCHSVFRYVADISAKSCEDYRLYLAFVVENAKLYPNLLAFLREKDTIAIRKGSAQVQILDEI